MAGGLLQLIAYGSQDCYLTNNPHITFFKIVYRRHTNLSIQALEKTFNDNPDFGKKCSVKLYRLGDLATKMHLRIILNEIIATKGIPFAWIRRIGYAMINQIEIKIGGNVIDRQYGTWLDIWYELARQGDHDRGYAKQIGDTNELTEYNDKDKPQYILYVPLQFWFNRHYGLALPLIAIQYHEIYINVIFTSNEKLIVRNDNFNDFTQVKIIEVGLVTDYIYLDIDERRKFSTIAHEYLIEQVQYFGENGVECSTKRSKLDFNHPTKELIWAMRNGNYTTGKHFLCYSNEENWDKQILACSSTILYQSMILLRGPEFIVDPSTGEIIPDKNHPGESPPSFGLWEEFSRGTEPTQSSNGNLIVLNESKNNSLWININSLTIGNYSITDKISATINVSSDNIITITDIITGISDRDISFPVEYLTDTRISSGDDICVYQFSNYGLFITGKVNPLSYALLEYNGENRFDKRDGKFFGDLQPYLHHSNTPKNGINLYSFAINPEEFQPSGTSNLSKIENIILTLWFEDISNPDGNLPIFPLYNLDNRLFIYCFSYNVLRVISGLVGLSYNG